MVMRARNHSKGFVMNLAGVWELQEVKTVLQGLQRVSTTGYSHMNASALIPQEERAALLDIGANIGIFSFVAAALGYNVYSFEAMPRNVAALHQTLCWNPDLLKTLTVCPLQIPASSIAYVVPSWTFVHLATVQ